MELRLQFSNQTDGDQVTVKIAYTIEANKELQDYLGSKKFYVDLGGNNVRNPSNEVIQALYNFTLILPETKEKLKPIEFY